MSDEEPSGGMTYADRFYSSRRAALSYSAILLIFSTATPVKYTSDVSSLCHFADSTVKLTFVDVCLNTTWISVGLMAAVIFYTLAFYRAHSVTDLLNKSAIAGSGENVTQALNRIALSLQSLESDYEKANKLIYRASEGAKGLFEKSSFAGMGFDNFLQKIEPTFSQTMGDARYFRSEMKVVEYKKDQALRRQKESLEQLLYHIVMDELENKLNSIRDRLQNIVTTKSKVDLSITEQGIKLSEISKKFSVLHKKYYGSTARWYIFYDVFLVYMFVGLSLFLGVQKLALGPMRTQAPWIFIVVCFIALAFVVIWYKWSVPLRPAVVSKWSISFRWPVSFTRKR